MDDFEKIYRKYFADVYKYSLSLSRNAAVAEDVVAETFFKAMKNISRFNGSCKLYVWLCQIAKNTYFSMLKKQNRTVSGEALAGLPDTGPDAETKYIDRDTAGLLHVKLHQMDEPYKEVFTLRVFGELPFAQIGELFDKTESWARLIFYRAKKRLQEVAE